MISDFLPVQVKDIILNPSKAWDKIDSDSKTVTTVRKSVFLPLVLLVTLSSIAGSLIYKNSELLPVYSVLVGVKYFFLIYITVGISAYLIKEVTYPLDLGRSFPLSYSLTVYSVVPFLLCQVLSSFFESLLFINILGLYGLYIFWTGTEKLLSPPAYKKMPLLISSLIIFIGIYIPADFLFTKLLDKFYYMFFA
jgi:hypothetical protein